MKSPRPVQSTDEEARQILGRGVRERRHPARGRRPPRARDRPELNHRPSQHGRPSGRPYAAWRCSATVQPGTAARCSVGAAIGRASGSSWWIRLLWAGRRRHLPVLALAAASSSAPTNRTPRRACSPRAPSRSLPFTLLGPFVGVFIDRWPRRAGRHDCDSCCSRSRSCRSSCSTHSPGPVEGHFFSARGVLAVVFPSIGSQLAAASAVVPRLVTGRSRPCWCANWIATVGGTLRLAGWRVHGRNGSTTRSGR